MQITVGKENGDTAEATLVFAYAAPAIGNQPTTRNLDHEGRDLPGLHPVDASTPSPTTVVVPMKKEKGEWKFDFPADANLQLRVGYLNDHYKDYVNPMEIVTQEVKNDPSTKENVTTRLKTLLEQAAKE